MCGVVWLSSMTAAGDNHVLRFLSLNMLVVKKKKGPAMQTDPELFLDSLPFLSQTLVNIKLSFYPSICAFCIRTWNPKTFVYLNTRVFSQFSCIKSRGVSSIKGELSPYNLVIIRKHDYTIAFFPHIFSLFVLNYHLNHCIFLEIFFSIVKFLV